MLHMSLHASMQKLLEIVHRSMSYSSFHPPDSGSGPQIGFEIGISSSKYLLVPKVTNQVTYRQFSELADTSDSKGKQKQKNCSDTM